MKEKQYIIRKYIMATSAMDAIRKEKQASVDDVWVDEKWKDKNACVSKPIEGFKPKK